MGLLKNISTNTRRNQPLKTVPKSPVVDIEQVIGYQCPMKCEGEEIYDHPGSCPVCKTKLVPADQ